MRTLAFVEVFAKMLTDLDIMKLHVEALFTHDEHGRLKCVNEENGADAPRFFLGRTTGGDLCRFRFDVPGDLAERLEALSRQERSGALGREPEYLSEYVRLLEAHSPVQKIETGPSYIFPNDAIEPPTDVVMVTSGNADVLRGGFEDWIPDAMRGGPFAAVLREGRVVSVCYSARITPEAHEAGVETLAAYRGRGCAADACNGWADEVRRRRAIPLYSTSWQNKASQRVAHKLALHQYGVVFHVR